jgi:hypothetical protein
MFTGSRGKVSSDESKCPGVCIPYSQQACRDAAASLGLSVDESGFSGSFTYKGCYAYSAGKHKGKAFYGTGGSRNEMQKQLPDDRYRPKNYGYCAAVVTTMAPKTTTTTRRKLVTTTAPKTTTTTVFKPSSKAQLIKAIEECLQKAHDEGKPYDCSTGTNGAIGDWDVSAVTDMSFLFNGNKNPTGASKDIHYVKHSEQFNGDISKWDVSIRRDEYGLHACFHTPPILMATFPNGMYRA